jgi:hypothetical protein
MSETCSMNGEKWNAYELLVEKLEGRKATRARKA